MGKPAFQRQLHQFLRWWGHVFEDLPKRHHRETSILEVLALLDRTPPVESDLANIELGAKIGPDPGKWTHRELAMLLWSV